MSPAALLKALLEAKLVKPNDLREAADCWENPALFSRRVVRQREVKPSSIAIRIYCEEYKTAREQSGVVPPKDQRNLGQVYVDLGEDQMRAALRVFFELKEQWIRDTSYSAGAFLGALPRCHARAQGIAASEERKRAREREDAERLAREGGSWDDIPAETQRKAASLFGGAK